MNETLTNPTEPVRAIDAFEHWLQGRINTCVSGLMDRIATLERQVSELHAEDERVAQRVETAVDNYLDHSETVQQIADAVVMHRTLYKSEEFCDAVRELFDSRSDTFRDAVIASLDSGDLNAAIEQALKHDVELRVVVA